MIYQLYKLIHNTIILDFGFTKNDLSKILYYVKQKILNEKHENKKLIEYFKDNTNDLYDLKVFEIEKRNFKSLKEAKQFLNDYKNKNECQLFIVKKYCYDCDMNMLKNENDEHLISNYHNENIVKKKQNNFIKIHDFIYGSC